jgi:hypothetical protein
MVEYMHEMRWREDTRRQTQRTLVTSLLKMTAKAPVSKRWTNYWGIKAKRPNTIDVKAREVPDPLDIPKLEGPMGDLDRPHEPDFDFPPRQPGSSVALLKPVPAPTEESLRPNLKEFGLKRIRGSGRRVFPASSSTTSNAPALGTPKPSLTAPPKALPGPKGNQGDDSK